MSATADRPDVVNEDATVHDVAVTPGRAEVDERPGLQERLERSTNGRALISCLVALTLVAIVVVNMPNSQTKERLLPVVQPYVNALGLDQGWAVFAPNPRGLTSYLEARVTYQDGSVVSRPIPIQHGLAEYWDYRWQRWGEQLLFGPEGRSQWGPYCQWIAARERDAGRRPVSVALVSTSAQTLPVGPGPDRRAWSQRIFFSTSVGP